MFIHCLNFRKELYDLFILDIKMPKMHGFEDKNDRH